ncbi:hypothetical protein BJ138DRAFT_1107143, partial [Hygrophoropsis aurantiaca]
GIAAGVIVTFLGIFFWRRRSQTPAYAPASLTETGELPRSPPAMPGSVSSAYNPRGSVSRLYNPNDPTTFSSSGAPSNSAWAGSDAIALSAVDRDNFPIFNLRLRAEMKDENKRKGPNLGDGLVLEVDLFLAAEAATSAALNIE